MAKNIKFVIMFTETRIMKVCSFFGHSILVKCRLSYDLLVNTIEKQILNGVDTFLIGSYEEFDNMCMLACLKMKVKYFHIKIVNVRANIHRSFKEKPTNDVEMISYEIEQYFYKQRITKTNELMIKNSDIIIFYVDTQITNNGAGRALNYAIKQNKPYINLFKK